MLVEGTQRTPKDKKQPAKKRKNNEKIPGHNTDITKKIPGDHGLQISVA